MPIPLIRNAAALSMALLLFQGCAFYQSESIFCEKPEKRRSGSEEKVKNIRF